MSETDISLKIRKAIEKAYPEIRFTRHHCGLAKGWHGGLIKLGDAGWPDYIGYLPDGRFFGLEIKDPSGRTAKQREQAQGERLNDISLCGGIGLKVSSVEEALEKIKPIMESIPGN